MRVVFIALAVEN